MKIVVSVKQILEIESIFKNIQEIHNNDRLYRKNKEDVWQKF